MSDKGPGQKKVKCRLSSGCPLATCLCECLVSARSALGDCRQGSAFGGACQENPSASTGIEGSAHDVTPARDLPKGWMPSSWTMQGAVRDKKVGTVPRRFLEVPGWCVHKVISCPLYAPVFESQ